jgi:diguanylate cyclase (GGDEF)-like protein/PAS domain S-box-containing protein
VTAYTHDDEHFESVLDSLGVGVVVLGRDGRVQSTNLRAREILHFRTDWASDGTAYQPVVEVLDEHGRELIPDELPAVRTLRTGEPFANVVQGVRRPGSATITWLLVGTHPERDASGKVERVICTYVDITEQRAAQESVRASEERFHLFAENAADVIYRVAFPPLRFEYINPAVASILGYTRDDFYRDPRFVFELVHPDDVEAARAHLSNLDGATDPLVIRMTRRDGAVIYTEHRIVPVVEFGQLVALEGIVRDVTALKHAQADLNRLAHHDALTGLPNRRQLLDALDRALTRTRSQSEFLAVLYIDADRFKAVNDNLGHDVGDRLLRVIGTRLEQTLRPTDSVARLGGDEFAAVLSELADEQEAIGIAERVLAVLAEPIDLGEGELVATVSIGVASSESGRTTPAELLRRADLAMYAAKDRGRARVELYGGPIAVDGERDA